MTFCAGSSMHFGCHSIDQLGFLQMSPKHFGISWSFPTCYLNLLVKNGQINEGVSLQCSVKNLQMPYIRRILKNGYFDVLVIFNAKLSDRCYPNSK